jgi:hypothetical protein
MNMCVIVAITVVTWICLTPLRPVFGQNVCAASSCVDCLNQNCAWFTVDSDSTLASECLEACSAIPDVPCYTNQINPSESYESICATAETDIPDWTTCSLALDCTSCVSVLQSDGVSPCTWYEEGSFCGSGLCTEYGCGSTMCSNTPVPAPTTSVATAPTSLCNLNATTCEECLIAMDNTTEIPYSCAWSTDRCIDSCADVAGFPCYSVAAYPDLVSTPIEICLLEQSATKDDDLCASATMCAQCTDLVQTDGKTGCLWFERDGIAVTPYCGAHNSSSSVAQVDANGCDLNGICGVSDCSLTNVIRSFTPAPVSDGAPNAAPRPTTTNTISGSEKVTLWLQLVLTAMASIMFALDS